MRQTTDDRFWNKVRQGHPWECWEWQAFRDADGYGSFRVDVYMVRTNRHVVGLENGDPLQALHRCDNPPCCNPAHLFVGTNAENMADKATKGRSASRSGHGMAKLTDLDVATIRTLYATGCYSQREIAETFGVSKSTVGRTVRRETWDG